MNAKELHDLYAPLWKAVPETRPRIKDAPGYGNPDLVLDLNEQGARWIAEGDDSPDWSDEIIPMCAAALCRVAAEDWLGRSVKWNEAWVYDGVPRHWSVHELLEGEDRRMIGDGPTKHHALVRACLAVHNASPSAAPPS